MSQKILLKTLPNFTKHNCTVNINSLYVSLLNIMSCFTVHLLKDCEV